MERELYTRNFMTGWILMAGFLISWLPNQNIYTWEQIKFFLEYSHLGTIAAVIAAFLGTPIIGYMVSSIVIFYLYMRKGDAYMNLSRHIAYEKACERFPVLKDCHDKNDAKKETSISVPDDSGNQGSPSWFVPAIIICVVSLMRYIGPKTSNDQQIKTDIDEESATPILMPDKSKGSKSNRSRFLSIAVLLVSTIGCIHHRISGDRHAKIGAKSETPISMLNESESHISDVFSYLTIISGSDSFIEWSRRRHTACSVGINWSVAIGIGMVSGSALACHGSLLFLYYILIFTSILFFSGYLERRIRGNKSGTEANPRYYSSMYSLCLVLLFGALYSLCWGVVWNTGTSYNFWVLYKTDAFVSWVLIIAISSINLYIGYQSERESEAVDRLWAQDYLSQKLNERADIQNSNDTGKK